MQKIATERTLVFGCLHTPFQHTKSHEALLDFIKFWKPQRIIENGDAHDLFNVSRYFRDPCRETSLQDEVTEGIDANNRLRKAAGKDAEILLNFGNHEYRWDMFLATNAPILRSLKCLEFEELFGLHKANIIPNRGRKGGYARYQLGPIQIGHFEVARDSAATEKSIMTAKGGSIIASHSHRKGQYFHSYADGRVLTGVGTGCLCDPAQQNYVEDPNWQHGFVTVERVIGKDRFHLHDVTITGGEFIYDGHIF